MNVCEIIVYHFEHMRLVYSLALRTQSPLQLSTPYAATAFAGVDYFLKGHKALQKEYGNIDLPFFIDCGPFPGYALAALRSGARYLYVNLKDEQVLSSLQSICKKESVVLLMPQNKPQKQFDLMWASDKTITDIESWILTHS